MSVLTHLILLYLLNFTTGKDCLNNYIPEYITTQKQLIQDLKCGYSKYDPPSTTIPVNFSFNVKSFNLNSYEGIFKIQNWVFATWKDERLKWDPTKYHGINETEVSVFGIWYPYLILNNMADYYDYDRIFSIRCFLKSTGEVLCVTWMMHLAWCSIRLTNWPYDVQECYLEFEIINSLQKDNYLIATKAVDIMGAEYSTDWYITNHEVVDADSTKQLKMTFTLERDAAGLAAIIVYPSIILSVLSISALFLDLKSKIRLGTACFSLYGHYYFLVELAANMPMKNAHPPTILLYYRGSLVLTVLIILLTFFLNGLCKLRFTSHHYIQSCNDFAYDGSRMYFVFPWWNADDSKRYSDWTKFANVVNSAFIYIILIAYLGLYGALMPKSASVKY